MTDFEVGDRVRLLSASYGAAVKGDEGTVTGWDYAHIIVYVRTDRGVDLSAYPRRFEKVVEPTFKPGDKVRWKDGRHKDATATVIEPVHELSSGLYPGPRTWTDYCGGTHTATADLELVKPSNVSTKFKVGDRIRPKDGQEYNGKAEATVVAPKPGDENHGLLIGEPVVWADWWESSPSYLAESKVELVPEPEPEKVLSQLDRIERKLDYLLVSGSGVRMKDNGTFETAPGYGANRGLHNVDWEV